MKESSNNQNINISKSKNVKIGDVNLEINRESGQNTSLSNSETLQSEISDLIAKGKTQKAIEFFLEKSGKNSDSYEEGIILLNRLNRVQTESRLDIISAENRNLELNKINSALLKLIKK